MTIKDVRYKLARPQSDANSTIQLLKSSFEISIRGSAGILRKLSKIRKFR